MTAHNRIHSMALVVLAMFAAMSSVLLLLLAGTSAGDAVHIIPAWSLPWVAAVNLSYAVAIVVTLYARRFRPEIGRALTRLLNWALLPALPGGTVVGLYGLLVANGSHSSHVPH